MSRHLPIFFSLKFADQEGNKVYLAFNALISNYFCLILLEEVLDQVMVPLRSLFTCFCPAVSTGIYGIYHKVIVSVVQKNVAFILHPILIRNFQKLSVH